jgi:hypothetical protein
MKLNHAVLAFLLIFFLPVFSANSQPILPAISGEDENGLVLLSWVCQYDGVKTIAVRRSKDSLYNFKIVGYVKQKEKGVQAFADGHPEPGNNYYKLNLVFNSGLNWSSNFCMVNVDTSQLSVKRATMPGNDSLQRFIITEEVIERLVPISDREIAVARAESGIAMEIKGVDGHKVPLLFDADSVARVPEQPVLRKKLKLSIPEVDMDEAVGIQSMYVLVNRLNGHVEMTLPEDYKGHQFSIKFYNQQKQMILDVAGINAPKVILDKRNFQRKGKYKFVFRKDGLELESGYITITF